MKNFIAFFAFFCKLHTALEAIAFRFDIRWSFAAYISYNVSSFTDYGKWELFCSILFCTLYLNGSNKFHYCILFAACYHCFAIFDLNGISFFHFPCNFGISYFFRKSEILGNKSCIQGKFLRVSNHILIWILCLYYNGKFLGYWHFSAFERCSHYHFFVLVASCYGSVICHNLWLVGRPCDLRQTTSSCCWKCDRTIRLFWKRQCFFVKCQNVLCILLGNLIFVKCSIIDSEVIN